MGDARAHQADRRAGREGVGADTPVGLGKLVAGKDFLFAVRGEASLKGFDEPVRLYE